MSVVKYTFIYPCLVVALCSTHIYFLAGKVAWSHFLVTFTQPFFNMCWVAKVQNISSPKITELIQGVQYHSSVVFK